MKSFLSLLKVVLVLSIITAVVLSIMLLWAIFGGAGKSDIVIYLSGVSVSALCIILSGVLADSVEKKINKSK